MDQRIIDLYDEYTHRPLDRREFLDRLRELAGGEAAAQSMLALLENNYDRAEQVAASAAGIRSERIQFPGATGPVSAYFARPEGEGKAPGVIVIHENRGLNPHIEDVARRAAAAGFVALAPDLLSPLGGTPSDEDEARQRISRLDRGETVANLKSARSWLAAHPATTGKVGAVGFCWGGGMVNQLAVADPELNAGVVFYGSSPNPEQVEQIAAPLLLHYAELDHRINATVPTFEEALKRAKKVYTLHMYPGVNHAFHNDTNAARYDAAAARLAWERTIAFFEKHLK